LNTFCDHCHLCFMGMCVVGADFPGRCRVAVDGSRDWLPLDALYLSPFSRVYCCRNGHILATRDSFANETIVMERPHSGTSRREPHDLSSWLGACASIHVVAYPAAESAAHARVPARQNCVVHLSSAGGIGGRFEVQHSKVLSRRVNSKDGELCVNPVR
jgi:hypothetical protein